ncbi:MAG: capsid assembly protein, partial [Prevotella sp.]|nr:capsid assembly protein [Prevotella sp.]
MEDSKKLETTIEGFDASGQKEDESSFNLKTVFTLVIINWPWFILSMFIFICGALMYLRYTDPVYSVSMKMLIKDDTSNRRPSNQMLSNMQDFGFISNSTGIENEVEILQTRRLAQEAVKDLKLYTEYYVEGKLKRVLIYKTQPVSADLDPESLAELSKKAPGGFSFTITRNGNKYDVENEDNSLPFKGS